MSRVKFQIKYVIATMFVAVVLVFGGVNLLNIGFEVACPAVWEPVCGVDDKTYSNSCYAEVAGVEISYEGECLVSTPPFDDCQTLWWYDDSSTTCQEKEFCGAYMYEGLHTFSTLEACETKMPPLLDGDNNILLIGAIGAVLFILYIIFRCKK